MCAVPLPLAQSCVCTWEMANHPQLPVAPPVLLTCGSVEDLQEKPSGTSVCAFSIANCGMHDFTYNLQCEEIILLISSTSLHLLWYPPEGSRNWHGRLLLRPHRSMFLRYCQSQQTLIKHNIFKINIVSGYVDYYICDRLNQMLRMCKCSICVIWNVIYDWLHIEKNSIE